MSVCLVLIALFLIYSLIRIFLEILELNFVKSELRNEAVILEKDEYEKAGKISIANRKFEIFSIVYSFVLVVFWLSFGLKFLESLVIKSGSLTENLAFVMGFIVISAILNLPLEIYSKFIKDRKFGFSTITPKVFIIDTLKSLALTLIFGGAVVFLLLYLISVLGDFWWFWGFVLSFIIILVINFIYPTIIAPLFNKVKPLDDESLRGDIERLMDSCGFKSSGIFSLDASKRDNRLNAYFGGLGSSKRVVLFDTLLNSLNRGEILAVLGHELGHFKNGDIVKNLAFGAVVLFATFFIFGNLPELVFSGVGVQKNGGSMLVMMMILSNLLSFFITPLQSFLSRKKEFGADEFGASIQSVGEMVSALKKLGSHNKAFPKSHPLYSAIYHSHPTLFERVKELESHR